MPFIIQDGATPLMTASFYGHHHVVMTLIEAGADISQTNNVSIIIII